MTINLDLNQRTQHLLRLLIECYIDEGQPISSKRLTQASGLDLSTATIRHIMADLENMGLIASPHTSSGRIPTPQGYRLFVDNLLVVKPLDHSALTYLQHRLHNDQHPQELMNNAAQILSELTHSVGIIQTPKHEDPKLQHIEFIKLSDQRVLIVLVTTDGNVQNRLLTLPENYSEQRLREASELLNKQYAGCSFNEMRERIHTELRLLKADMVSLLSQAVENTPSNMQSNTNNLLVSGERHLIHTNDIATDVHALRKLFHALEERTELLRLMHLSHQAQGVQIYIGGESSALPINTCSLITRSYMVHGKVMGTLGVIGPTRMPYEKIIPIVDMTARLLSNALTSTLPPPKEPL